MSSWARYVGLGLIVLASGLIQARAQDQPALGLERLFSTHGGARGLAEFTSG